MSPSNDRPQSDGSKATEGLALIEYVWRYRDLDVYYEPDLDGDGTSQASSFVSFIRNRYGNDVTFGTAFEWCAGPAFIGFALLREGLCEELCVADINPHAIDHARRTIERNGLDGRVRAYVSDNLIDVPDSEMFDLVVANPPNFYAISPDHQDYEWLRDDLRPNDPGWEIHRRFYQQIGAHMRPGAQLLIQEVEPYSDKVFVPADSTRVWDIRPRPPIEDFANQIEDGGLDYTDAVHFHTDEKEGIRMWLVISTTKHRRSEIQDSDHK